MLCDLHVIMEISVAILRVILHNEVSVTGAILGVILWTEVIGYGGHFGCNNADRRPPQLCLYTNIAAIFGVIYQTEVCTLMNGIGFLPKVKMIYYKRL